MDKTCHFSVGFSFFPAVLTGNGSLSFYNKNKVYLDQKLIYSMLPLKGRYLVILNFKLSYESFYVAGFGPSTLPSGGRKEDAKQNI